eukprot:NODE_4803_length_759_cov_24.116901_g4454_i0.p1 GENE.NODE_4803_length_759_cov_24.116901_g4454_i0~~NODE_4803_length_759_cov_24.116901_g4454_i0.p1  ORF type:complete len:122 (-),score=29.85 NODE_4803_length_759_cov_24.116901_g4454_i0:294-659(-)
MRSCSSPVRPHDPRGPDTMELLVAQLRQELESSYERNRQLQREKELLLDIIVRLGRERWLEALQESSISLEGLDLGRGEENLSSGKESEPQKKRMPPPPSSGLKEESAIKRMKFDVEDTLR